jgi:hypothetical protein
VSVAVQHDLILAGRREPGGGRPFEIHGREGLRYAIREQTEPKLLVLNLSRRPGR